MGWGIPRSWRSSKSPASERPTSGCGRRSWGRSTFAPALRNLGVLYLTRGDPEAAEAALLQSIRHDSTSAVAHRNLAELYSRRGQHERARAALDKAERLSEGEPASGRRSR